MQRRSFLRAGAGIAGTAALSGCLGIADPFAHRESWEFEEVSENVGLDYEARASGVGNGDSGVYVTDYDNDGWPDVLAIGGPEPVLYENTGGEFARSDALPTLDLSVQGALFFDADSDGWEDLLLLPRNDRAVFLKNEGGEFVRQENRLDVELNIAVGATAADYDGNGNLDVFVIQYGDWGEGTPEGFRHPDGGYVADDNGAPNLLFRNTGDGFERAEDTGIEGEHWSLATSSVDFTGNGYPDIHVANDFNNDVLYLNDGDGRFERVVMGTETARNGMSSEIGDFNGDGQPDVFVTNIYFPLDEADLSDEKQARLQRYFEFVLRSKRIEGNNLLINRGNGTFAAEAGDYGVKEGGWGWAAVHTDLDNDMHRELFHGTQELVRIDEENPHYTYPMLWTGTDDGFEKVEAKEYGFEETNDRGVAAIDFDRDGDVDLLVSTYNGGFKLYQNNADGLDGRNSLQIHVVRADGETTAIGAEVEVSVGNTTQHAVVNARTDYQSQDERTLHFGLADHKQIDRLRVRWPDGTEQTVEDIEANRRIVIDPSGDIRTDSTE